MPQPGAMYGLGTGRGTSSHARTAMAAAPACGETAAGGQRSYTSPVGLGLIAVAPGSTGLSTGTGRLSVPQHGFPSDCVPSVEYGSHRTLAGPLDSLPPWRAPSPPWLPGTV